MTEISTNESDVTKSPDDDQQSAEDDLEHHEKQFYNSLSTHLNKLQLHPKQETIFKIITYSQSKK